MTHWQPIDKIALTLIFFLSLVMGLLVLGGQACGRNCFFSTAPHVRSFSWQERQIGAEDTAFILAFDRPMEHNVEENLSIKPPLPGKISWAGKRLAYTLDLPAPYGQTYQVSLEGVREHFAAQSEPGQIMQPFVGQFSSRDRAFAYIGSQGNEQGRLILYNLTQTSLTVLTPPNLVVMDFQFYPQGDKILFSAADATSGSNALQNLKLYTVTTGIGDRTPEKIELILDNQTYQNYEFDLAHDGATIVVQRVNRQNPADFGLWVIKSDRQPQPLNISGGEFLIAPDSQTLAVAQGEGIGLLTLELGAEPLDFLPQFGRVLSFSRDGSAAAMVDYNTDDPQRRYTRSLYYVNNQGVQKELLNTQGSVIDCQFDPTATHLYCLLTQLLKGEAYQEQPYFAVVNLETAEVVPLLTLPGYQDLRVSVAPDGLGLLFDQVMTDNTLSPDKPFTASSGEAIVDSRLWLLILSAEQISNSRKPQLEPLPLVGIRPQWLP